MAKRKHTSLWITPEQATPLRRMAARMDILQPKASTPQGSASGIVRELAAACEQDEDAVFAALRPLLRPA